MKHVYGRVTGAYKMLHYQVKCIVVQSQEVIRSGDTGVLRPRVRSMSQSRFYCALLWARFSVRFSDQRSQYGS